ncbi:hypothetical protein QYE76_048963 [Lolium multiflorum]|uniref:Uncharacterized protein n=1 Tax=Lolium multiflorum TaxID=4521 RepID=A0AAD8WFW2_LOLMU|nr:hypothetical protein QYE76_048963 [Lolium multiflorum]
MPSYYCWTKHGERGVMMEDNDEEEEDDDGYPNFPEYDDTAEGNEDNEVEDQEAPDELMMILAGPLLMQGENVKLKRKGQSNKGYNACTHCLHELEGDYLEKGQKVVYLGIVDFLGLPIPSHGFHRISNPPEAEALCASNYPCPPGYRVPTGWLLSVGGVPVPPVPLGVAREMAITNHYYFELTPEQRRNPRGIPTTARLGRASSSIGVRGARQARGGRPASFELQRGRPSAVVARPNSPGRHGPPWPPPALPSPSPRALPPRFDYRDPDASDDDDGDYDDYSGEYYRARHEYD